MILFFMMKKDKNLIDEYNSITIDDFIGQKNLVPWINEPKINKSYITK